MKFFSNIARKRGFWLLDRIKGNPFKKQYDEISFILENFNSPEAKKKCSDNLINVLDHAVQTTPYYKKFKDFKSLNDFPVIRKTVIQDHFNEFSSDSYTNKPKYKVATSGSTGVPFVLYQNKEKKLRNSADTLYFLENANYVLGEKLYDLEVWRGINMNNPTKASLKNLKYVDVTTFTDKEIETFLSTLKFEKKPQHLIGFVSAFENICKYLEKTKSEPLQLNIKSIIAISEYLTTQVKDIIQHYFQVPVVSRYSSEEVGVLAQQFPNFEKTDFQLNWASYHFEILDLHHDIPAKVGELGRIVVTDYFNYCMPLIRYDTGDIAILQDQDEHAAPSLKRIEGRRMDLIYNTKGECISSFLIYTKFYPYYDLLHQYQFIQKDATTYIVKLNIKETFVHEEKLIETIKADFGADASVQIEYVDDIPALSSGKRKKVMNLFHQ